MEDRYLIVGLFFIGVIVGSSDVKSSLTFVIDNTVSMTDDIEEVKKGANAIFDTVMNTNTSQIEDFVLVTFQDPDVRLNIKTRDRHAFIDALDALNADNLVPNWDCPEISMRGIELALQSSREGSFLYVFTDASAKDYYKYEDVEALSMKLGSQVVFVLTGVCYNDRTRTDNLVYHKLAKATNGQVFHLDRKEIGKILKYVEKTIESRKHIMASKTYPAGYGHSFDLVVDGDTKELVIAVSGEEPSIGVTDSGGSPWATTDITRLREVAIVKVVGIKPDVYKVEVSSKSETHIVVSGSTSVHFQHGFSIITPASIADTVKRPVPGEKSHLSIKLTTEDGNVELRSVFTLFDLIPESSNKIKGYDTGSKAELTRMSLTPVKPQDWISGAIKTPVVTIDGSPNINVEYDKPLELKCKVGGYPKPRVTWKSDGKSAVLSDNYPKETIPTPIMLEEGSASVIIPCSITHRKTDRMLWFKDGRMLSTELTFPTVRMSDSGIYICRVSSIDRPAESGSTVVEVGFKPRFNYDTRRRIPFVEDGDAVMDCSATGEPKPQLKWFHDGKEIKKPARYEFKMTNAKDRGRYICEVSNKFGTVQKEFKILSFDHCLLDINNDFNENEPLMLTPDGNFVDFGIKHGYLRIPTRTNITLACPSKFIKIDSREIHVTCEKERFKLPSGRSYKYSDLKCSSKLQPSVIKTGSLCNNGVGELFTVGLKIDGLVKEVYNVCVDITHNPIYTTFKMQPSLANVTKKDAAWFHKGLPVDLDTLYDCSYQNSEISKILQWNFHRHDGCCFARRMLVNSKDVAHGLPQAATYTHLNVVPHWSTCNSKNWEKVEQLIRDLVKSSNRMLQVFTGAAESLELPDAHSELKNMTVHTGERESQIPKYLWKVIQDESAKASLAIIQVNVPDLSRLTDANYYRRCDDICSYVTWLLGRNWRSIRNGYIYCCRLADFEGAFGYRGVFQDYPRELLD